jgi:hypothetical protein
MLPYAGPALYVSGCLPEVVPNIVKIDLCATTSNQDEKNENDRQTDRQLKPTRAHGLGAIPRSSIAFYLVY